MNKITKVLLGLSCCLGIMLLSGCSQKQEDIDSGLRKNQKSNLPISEETNNLGVQSLRKAKDIKRKAEERDRLRGEDFGL